MKGQGTGGEKMLILGELISLAIPRGAIMGKTLLLWVSRLLENAFATFVDIKKLSDTDAHTNLKVHVLLCKYLYILFY